MTHCTQMLEMEHNRLGRTQDKAAVVNFLRVKSFYAAQLILERVIATVIREHIEMNALLHEYIQEHLEQTD